MLFSFLYILGGLPAATPGTPWVLYTSLWINQSQLNLIICWTWPLFRKPRLASVSLWSGICSSIEIPGNFRFQIKRALRILRRSALPSACHKWQKWGYLISLIIYIKKGYTLFWGCMVKWGMKGFDWVGCFFCYFFSPTDTVSSMSVSPCYFGDSFLFGEQGAVIRFSVWTAGWHYFILSAQALCDHDPVYRQHSNLVVALQLGASKESQTGLIGYDEIAIAPTK